MSVDPSIHSDDPSIHSDDPSIDEMTDEERYRYFATESLRQTAEFYEEQRARDYEVLVSKKVVDFRARKDARSRLRREGRQLPPDLISAAELIASAPKQPAYRVAELWPRNGRIVLAAQHKTGKTTFVLNLVRSLLDGTPFLGRFDVERARRVILLDTEMDRVMLSSWLRSISPSRADALDVLPLRGLLGNLDFLDSDGLQEVADRIGSADVLVVDCLRPLLDAHGLDENHEAGQFLGGLDDLAARAGISEILVVHHTGHVAERARGDSRILDWPDANWTMRKGSGPSAPRTLQATGRDVDVVASMTFDATTKRLSADSDAEGSTTNSDPAVDLETLAVITAKPGINTTSLRDAVSLKVRVRHGHVEAAVSRLVARGLVRQDIAGRATLHFCASANANPTA